MNQEPDFYKTSLSNFMDEKLTLLPMLFFNRMIEKDKPPYQSCGAIIKSCKMLQIKSTNGTNVCGKRNRDKYFELC